MILNDYQGNIDYFMETKGGHLVEFLRISSGL